MTSNVTTGFGSALYINTGSGLVKVAEVDDIPELPSFSTGLYETTSFDSVAVQEFKKRPLKEGVEFTITGNYVIGSTAEDTLDAADAASGALAYKIAVSQDADDFEFTGSALFYNLKKMNSKDEKRTFQITVKPTTAVSQAAV